MHIRRALISVSDKRGLIPFATKLKNMGVEILSTGGTHQELRKAGIEAIKISTKTGFPEIMEGRVKTLHPIIHGGLLGRRGQDDDVMREHNIEPIDLLVVNLYPFEQENSIENIDIGGPAMIRSAAKNYEYVIVVVDPDMYNDVLEKDMTIEYRRELSARAFGHAAAYDTAISKYLSPTLDNRFLYAGNLIEKLRYGENPHQDAAFYIDQTHIDGSIATAKQLQGKALSYNNIADSDTALECVKQFSQSACVIVKHANPCGVAVSLNIELAYKKAFATDPTSAFGGVIAFNGMLDGKTARAIVDKQFVEVIIAPVISTEALAVTSEKKNIRVLETSTWHTGSQPKLDYKKVSGGLLVQDIDTGTITEDDLEIVTVKSPTEKQIADLLFAWKVAKFVKSNAIVFCKDGMTIGVGAGQMSRVYSTKIAAMKAADEKLTIKDSVLASDAFFPFRDGIDTAAEHSIAAIIQPGGSIRDDEVIEAANEHGLAMVFTGMRHFRH